ncbi:MAG TPA: PEP-CTERM sorting domain-containing protein [Planctomycetota bacterium]|nr:PEP-CTERM sorting domain-containing protein [Planctomycetota bacterium]
MKCVAAVIITLAGMATSAAADTIIGPFDTEASFDPPEIMLNSTSGAFNVGLNLDWIWAEEYTWMQDYGGTLRLMFLEASGKAAPEFFLPYETMNVAGGTVRQNGSNFAIWGQVSYVPLHVEYNGLVEGSYFIELDRDYSRIGRSSVFNDSAVGIPIAEPLRITVVPEPCTLAIAGMGFAGLAWARRRLRRCSRTLSRGRFLRTCPSCREHPRMTLTLP